MVHVAKFESVGDWEALFIDGEPVKQNHIGRVGVLSYLEGETIEAVETGQVNLPEDVYQYPTLQEMDENEDFDYELHEYFTDNE